MAELDAQLESATRYADGQGQHIGQLEAQLGDAQRRQQSLQKVCSWRRAFRVGGPRCLVC